MLYCMTEMEKDTCNNLFIRIFCNYTSKYPLYINIKVYHYKIQSLSQSSFQLYMYILHNTKLNMLITVILLRGV